MASGETATVLLVDDDPAVVETYEELLDSDYDVRVAMDGEAAVEAMDDTVDVVLLDRRMGDVSGDEVLTEIEDSGHDCRVAMVSGVEPDVDVIRMGFDAYLVKPVTSDELVGTVEDLLARTAYRDDTIELFSLLSKKSVLEQERPPEELERSDEYQVLLDEIAELREQVDGFHEVMSEEDFRAEMMDIDPESDETDGQD